MIYYCQIAKSMSNSWAIILKTSCAFKIFFIQNEDGSKVLILDIDSAVFEYYFGPIAQHIGDGLHQKVFKNR